MNSYENLLQKMRSKITDAERKLLLKEFLLNNVNLQTLFPLLVEPHPVNMHFAWFLGDLCTKEPEVLKPYLTYLFNNRHQFQILNFNRSLAKFFFYMGIPDDISSEVLDALYLWMRDNQSDVSTRVFCLKAIAKFCKANPDFKQELMQHLELLLPQLAPNSFYKLASTYLFTHK